MKRILLILAACACACAWAGVASARLGSLGRNDTVVTNVTDVTPGNYAAVSNAAMNARSMTDLGVRGAPVSYVFGWFTVNGDVFALDGGIWQNDRYPFVIVSTMVDMSYYLSGSDDVNFTLSDNFSATAVYEGVSYSIVGYTNTLAQVSQIPDVSGYATQQQATNAAVSVADAKISTNNAAFVSAVLAVPLTGADAGDLAEISEYGGYGTVGAALLALIAGLAALKRRVTSAETALAQKANATDLPYRLVEPGKWEFSGSGVQSGKEYYVEYDSSPMQWTIYVSTGLEEPPWSSFAVSEGTANDLAVVFGHENITATRASLPGHLCDRAGNRVVVSGDTTLTLPAAVPGYLRDFLVRLEISGSTVPTITFAAPTGETITYETDGDEFPVPDEAGDWLYSFTESCVAHKFAVALKKVNVVAQGGGT